MVYGAGGSLGTGRLLEVWFELALSLVEPPEDEPRVLDRGLPAVELLLAGADCVGDVASADCVGDVASALWVPVDGCVSSGWLAGVWEAAVLSAGERETRLPLWPAFGRAREDVGLRLPALCERIGSVVVAVL
jgi:hypothetical protein